VESLTARVDDDVPTSASRLPLVSLGLTAAAWLLIFNVSSSAPLVVEILPFAAISAAIAAGAVGVVISLRAHARRWRSIAATAVAVLTATFWFVTIWSVANSLTLTG
jgi:hypothetical protein